MNDGKWIPFPKQALALSYSAETVFEILFGGARGPGKTDAGIQWLHGEKIGKFDDGRDKYYIHHPRYRALVLRKSYEDLVDWIDRASYLFKYAGAEIVGKPAEIRWPSGAKFRLGHLKDRSSYEKYLGHEYQRLLIEELTLIPQKKYYTQILGSIRTSHPELVPQVFNTTNPGSVGHHWVYDRFVKPARHGQVFLGNDGRSRIYIPATIEDNPILLRDKGYMLYLNGLKKTEPNLYRAWRHGDWNVFEGQFFDDFDPYVNVTSDFIPKDDITFVGASDWGYSPRPFVLLLGGMKSIPWQGSYFYRLWLYDEIRFTKKTPQELAAIIKQREERIGEFAMLKIDPSTNTKAKDGSLSILDQFTSEGIHFTPANNNRPNGWQAVRKWLSLAPDGLPYMIISDKCNFLIKNLPMLVYDELKKDDLDTDGPDDEADALRYLCTHLKWIDGKISAVNYDKIQEAKTTIQEDKDIFGEEDD